MSEQYRKLTREELSQLAGEELPERAAMSLISSGVVAPAANFLDEGPLPQPGGGPVPQGEHPTMES